MIFFAVANLDVQPAYWRFCSLGGCNVIRTSQLSMAGLTHVAERVFIGTCGYSYPGDPPNGWGGVFYPKAGKKRIDQLAFYASYFDGVEINSTFYRPPSAETARGWLKRTPPEFIFAVKAWQKFTAALRIRFARPDGAAGPGLAGARSRLSPERRVGKGRSVRFCNRSGLR
jgi:hypothetical protein